MMMTAAAIAIATVVPVGISMAALCVVSSLVRFSWAGRTCMSYRTFLSRVDEGLGWVP